MRSISSLFGVSQPFDPDFRFVTSWLLRPKWLAAWRLTLSLYAFVTMFTELGLDGWPTNAQSFSYFTDLTYWGLAFYMLVSGFHTAMFARSGGVSYPLQRWPRVAQAAHMCFYTCNIVFPPVVTITFWVILYKPPFFPIRQAQWSNISMHAMNSGYMLSEVILTSTPVPAPLTLPVCIVIMCLYLGLAYLTYATQGFYTYSFLDPKEGAAKRAGYIVGILVASIIIWLVVSGLVWLRTKLTRGKQKGASYGESRYKEQDVEMVNTH
jgi:hypothetical protein